MDFDAHVIDRVNLIQERLRQLQWLTDKIRLAAYTVLTPGL